MLKTELDRRRCFATDQKFKYNLSKHLNLYQHIELCLEIMADTSNYQAQILTHQQALHRSNTKGLRLCRESLMFLQLLVTNANTPDTAIW